MPSGRGTSGSERRIEERYRKTRRRGSGGRKQRKTLADAVLGVIFAAALYVWEAFKRLYKGNARYIYAAVGLVVVLVVCIGLYWGFTHINAQVVYLDTERIGAVKITKDGEIKADYIYELAVKKLETDLGAEILPNEQVTVESVHAKKDEFVTLNYVTAEIAQRMTYKISALSIKVNGLEMAVVNNKKTADEIFESIKAAYYQEGLNITKAEFVEEVVTEPVFVEKDKVISRDDAYVILTANSKSDKTYTIKQGDSLDKIASNAGMTRDALLKINPAYTPQTILKIGETLNLVVSTPLLSVKTFERVTYTEVILKPVETVRNNGQKKSYQRIMQQGKDGQQTVTADIIRINGYEEGRDVIDVNITVPPITEIREVGTQ